MRTGTTIVVAAAGLIFGALLETAAAGPDDQFSAWSPAVNVGPPVNSSAIEFGPFISKDGLSLYFGSDRPGGFGGIDIWVAQRATREDAWSPARNVGPGVNTAFNDQAPTLSLDGHWLYFFSERPDGHGSLDLYVARRHNRRDDLGWRPAENLGAGVNTAASEHAPAHFEDDVTGVVTLFFTSNRAGGDDIYAATLGPDGAFGDVVAVAELNGPQEDRQPSVRRDGLEMFIASTRQGTHGALDIWAATRSSTADGWSAPVNVGPAVNTGAVEGRPALSFDGTEIYFQSTRAGGLGTFDLYRSTRTRLPPAE